MATCPDEAAEVFVERRVGLTAGVHIIQYAPLGLLFDSKPIYVFVTITAQRVRRVNAAS